MQFARKSRNMQLRGIRPPPRSIFRCATGRSGCWLTRVKKRARLVHGRIGSEHLLLGLLREESSFAAHLLNSRGLSLEHTREIVSQRQYPAGRARDIVEIHGEGWDANYIQAQLEDLRKYAWRKRQWRPLDTLIEIDSDRICSR